MPFLRRVTTTALAALTLTVPALTVATPAATAATAPKPQRLVSGWLPYWSMTAAKANVTGNGDLVSIASPFWYDARSTTAISGHSGAGNTAVIADLRRKGIKVVPTVTDGVSPATLSKIMNTTSLRKAHVNALVNLAVAKGYDGLDLDYEKMCFGSTRTQRPALRTGFTLLVRDLSAALHARKKMLTIAVAPTTANVPGTAAYVYDYRALGRYVDRFRIMTYDYSWRGGTAGHVAPITWQNRVINYATSTMPRSKVQMGIPAYGYNWGKTGTPATSVTYAQAIALQKQYKAARKWDAYAQSPYFTYRDAKKVTHRVYYTDAAAILARVNLAKKLGINGVTFWAFGQEDPRMWSAIRSVSKSAAVKKPAPKPVVKTVAISTRWSATTVRAGSRPTLTVFTSKAQANRVAIRQRYLNGKWHVMASGRLNRNGAYAFQFGPVPKGRLIYRVYLPATKTAKAVYSKPNAITSR